MLKGMIAPRIGAPLTATDTDPVATKVATLIKTANEFVAETGKCAVALTTAIRKAAVGYDPGAEANNAGDGEGGGESAHDSGHVLLPRVEVSPNAIRFAQQPEGEGVPGSERFRREAYSKHGEANGAHGFREPFGDL